MKEFRRLLLSEFLRYAFSHIFLTLYLIQQKDVIRVYFSGGEDVSYKSVAITSATTADEVAHMMVQEYLPLFQYYSY